MIFALYTKQLVSLSLHSPDDCHSTLRVYEFDYFRCLLLVDQIVFSWSRSAIIQCVAFSTPMRGKHASTFHSFLSDK